MAEVNDAVVGEVRPNNTTELIGKVLRGEVDPVTHEPPPEVEAEAAPEDAPVDEQPAELEAAADETPTEEPEPPPSDAEEQAGEENEEPATEAKYTEDELNEHAAVQRQRAARFQRQAEEAQVRAQKAEDEARNARATIESLVTLSRNDPRAVLSQFAKATGRSEESVLRQVAQQIIENPLGEPPKDEPKDGGLTAEEIRRIMREEAAEMAKTREQKSHQSYRASQLQNLQAVKSDPDLQKHWPNLAMLAEISPKRFEYELEAAVDWALQNNPGLLGTGLPNLATQLDKAIESEYSTAASRLTARSGTPPQGEVAVSEKAPPKRARQPKRNPLTNQGTSERDSSEMTTTEKTSQIGELMRSALKL